MIVRFGMAPRRHGLTVDQFKHHWRTTHASAAAQIPNMVTYVQNHTVTKPPIAVAPAPDASGANALEHSTSEIGEGLAPLPYPGFDVLSEIEFESLADMDEGFASPVFQGSVRDDETQLIDPTRHFALLTERSTVIGDRPDGGHLKAISLFRTSPTSTTEALQQALTGPFAEVLAADGVDHLEVFTVLPEAHIGRPPPPCDVLVVVRLAEPQRALAHHRSPARSSADRELAGFFFGRADLCAEVVRVL